MAYVPINPNDIPLVTPLNALAPGGQCRCNGLESYGDTASCDAPPALKYILKRSAPIHEEDYDLSIHNTFGLWDCWKDAVLYLELIDATNVPSYTQFEPWSQLSFPGPYGGWDCLTSPFPEMPAYWYAAYRSGSSTPMAIAKVTSNVMYNGVAFYKVLYLHLASNITWPSPSACELSALPPVTRSCGSVLYVSAPFQTPYAAWMAHAPCLNRIGTAYLFTNNQHVFGNACDGEPCNIDQIDVVNDISGINMQAHNESMYGWIQQLNKFGTRKFCHCSELIDGTYGYQSGGTWYGYPSSITVAVSGFTDHEYRSGTYKAIYRCAFLNGTYTLIPHYPGSITYSLADDVEVTLEYYQCNGGNEELVGTSYEWPSGIGIDLFDCGHSRTKCRSIVGGASAGMQSCKFFWGDDWAACDPFGNRSEWVAPEPNPIPAGFDNAALCSGMIGSPARRGFFGQSGDVVVLSRSLNMTILSINP